MSPESIPKPAKKYLAQEFGTLSDVVYDSAVSLREICKVANDPSKNSSIAQVIYDKEDLADEIRERLNQSFSLEHHPPSILLDQVTLMISLNKITNKIEHAAKQIEYTGKYFPSVQIPALGELVDIVLIAVTKICRSVNIIFDSFEQSAEEVRDLEDIRDKARTKLFEIQSEVLERSETTFQVMFAVEKITLRVEQVAERAKQTADLIKNMALKYL